MEMQNKLMENIMSYNQDNKNLNQGGQDQNRNQPGQDRQNPDKNRPGQDQEKKPGQGDQR